MLKTKTSYNTINIKFAENMLPIGKSSCSLDDGDLSDENNWGSSSSCMDLFDVEVDDVGADSLNLFDDDGLMKLKPESSNASDHVQVVRVYPNGHTEEKQISIANIGTHEERELINYLSGKRDDSYKSDTADQDGDKWADKCMSKNAIAARENRKKKKEYTTRLETTVETLETENNRLKSRNDTLESSVNQLKTEVEYLQSVIANQSTLSHLLGNIQNIPGVKFQTSMSVNCCPGSNKENVKDINDNSVGCQANKENRKRKVEDTCNPCMSNVESKKRVCTRFEKNIATSTVTSSEMEQKNDDKALAEPCTSLGLEHKSHDQESSGVSSSGMPPAGPAGVCLHVSNGSISLEFCASCASNAAYGKAISYDHSYGKTEGEGRNVS